MSQDIGNVWQGSASSEGLSSTVDAVVSEEGGELEELRAAVLAVTASENCRDRLVVAARDAGASWRDIAAVLGVSAQAAHKRYRHLRGDLASGRTWQERPLPL